MINIFQNIAAVHTYDDLPSWVINYVEPTIYWIVVAEFLFIDVLFYRQYKKSEAGRKFLLGVFTFAVCFTIARALENYRKFYMASSRLNIVEGWVGLGPRIEGVELWIRISYYIFSWISIAVFYFITEKYVFNKKTKYIFTIGSIVEGIASIMLYFTYGQTQVYWQDVATVFFFVCAIAPIVLYYLMAYRSTGVLRKYSFYAATGLLFFVAGILGELPESQFVMYMSTGAFLDAYIIAVFSPIAMLIGVTLLAIAYRHMFEGIL